MSAEGENGGQVRRKHWAPGPCANFQEITMENMPVLPLEESWTNTLTAFRDRLLVSLLIYFFVNFGTIVIHMLVTVCCPIRLMLSASGDVLKIYRNIIFYAYYEYAVSLRLVCIFSEILHFFRKILSSVTVIPSCICFYIDYLFNHLFQFICSSYLFVY